ncbi:MAG: hypothetical protein AAF993_23220, partial [Pseudomonadota bacterium]
MISNTRQAELLNQLAIERERLPLSVRPRVLPVAVWLFMALILMVAAIWYALIHDEVETVVS